MDVLRLLLEQNQFDILTIFKSWLDNYVNDCVVSIPGYYKNYIITINVNNSSAFIGWQPRSIRGQTHGITSHKTLFWFLNKNDLKVANNIPLFV
jgi:hypothetical protein